MRDGKPGNSNAVQSGGTAAIIHKLTDFYQQYYELLERRQACTCKEEEYQYQLFLLCHQLIDAYQDQKTLMPPDTHTLHHADSTSQKAASASYDSNYAKECTAIAQNSADLARALLTGYEYMTINNNPPVLWYRGQGRYDWKTLPNIMRTDAHKQCRDGSFRTLKEEYRWAKAKILPTGSNFVKPDWLAFLQHNGFKTNILDFSEALHPSLFFATENWKDEANMMPHYDAALIMFNPVLFNLAMEALDEDGKTDNNGKLLTDHLNRLTTYIQTGKQQEGDEFEPPLFADQEDISRYHYLFDWNQYQSDENLKYPRAALVPRNCERMEKQSGQFVFYSLHCQGDASLDDPYEKWSLESLHEEYRAFTKKHNLDFVPFLFKIAINRFRYKDFKDYLRTIGMQKFQVYPEWDKLSEDLLNQLQIE